MHSIVLIFFIEVLPLITCFNTTKDFIDNTTQAIIISDAQRSSVWRSVAKASAERPDFAERERALERLTPER